MPGAAAPWTLLPGALPPDPPSHSEIVTSKSQIQIESSRIKDLDSQRLIWRSLESLKLSQLVNPPSRGLGAGAGTSSGVPLEQAHPDRLSQASTCKRGNSYPSMGNFGFHLFPSESMLLKKGRISVQCSSLDKSNEPEASYGRTTDASPGTLRRVTSTGQRTSPVVSSDQKRSTNIKNFESTLKSIEGLHF
ncbi:hypothetical protein Tco_0194384 [Tanacetum coccineum]